MTNGAPKPRRVCRNFQKGHCRFKDRCRDLHTLPEPALEEQIRSQQGTPEPPMTALPSRTNAAPPRAPRAALRTAPVASSPPTPASVSSTNDAPSTNAASAPLPKSKICSFYAKGKNCMYGNKCRKFHIRDGVQEPTKANDGATNGAINATPNGTVDAATNGSAISPVSPAPKKRAPRKKATTPASPAPAFEDSQTIPTFEYAPAMPEFEHFQTIPTYDYSHTMPQFEDFQTMPNMEDELFPIQRRSNRPAAPPPSSHAQQPTSRAQPATRPASKAAPPGQHQSSKDLPPHLNSANGAVDSDVTTDAPKQKFFQRRTPAYRKPRGGAGGGAA